LAAWVSHRGKRSEKCIVGKSLALGKGMKGKKSEVWEVEKITEREGE